MKIEIEERFLMNAWIACVPFAATTVLGLAGPAGAGNIDFNAASYMASVPGSTSGHLDPTTTTTSDYVRDSGSYTAGGQTVGGSVTYRDYNLDGGRVIGTNMTFGHTSSYGGDAESVIIWNFSGSFDRPSTDYIVDIGWNQLEWAGNVSSIHIKGIMGSIDFPTIVDIDHTLTRSSEGSGDVFPSPVEPSSDGHVTFDFNVTIAGTNLDADASHGLVNFYVQWYDFGGSNPVPAPGAIAGLFGMTALGAVRRRR